MKTIFITGATSFLGKSIIQKFQKNNRYRLIKTSLHGDKKNGVLALNLLDYKKTRSLLLKTKPQIILHFAALVNLTRDFDTASKCIEANITATLNLLEATKDNEVQKVIFASTEEVYGDNRTPFKESQIPLPPSMYSISKVAGENLMEYYSRLHNFNYIAFRFGTFYGPGSQSDRFITHIIQTALQHKPLLLNSGTLKRDYIFIDDAIDAIERAINHKLSKNTIINIGGEHAVSLHDFVKKVIHHSHSSSHIMLNAFPDRIGEAKHQKMDLSVSKRILGWEPKTSLDDGIKKSVDFFAQNSYYEPHAK